MFPGKEIVQPTIVEAVSFIAWKDEAFELGCQWATLYPDGSPSRAIINDFMNTSYLVNIVANDFKDGSYIFDPFLLDQPINGLTNGVVNGAAAAVNGVKETVNGLAEGVKNVMNGHGTQSRVRTLPENGQIM